MILGIFVGDDNFDEKEEQKEADLGEVDEKEKWFHSSDSMVIP